MDTYFFDVVRYNLLYNCSVYNVEDIPLADRQHPIVGAVYIFLFVILETLYIPCMVAIYSRLNQSTYKIMFVISLADVPCLWIVGLLNGYLGIWGAVFCSYPDMIYICGCLGQMFWGIEASSAVLLAINRCLEISNPYLGLILFHGRRTWIWLGCCLAYGAILGLLNKPILFSSIYMAWFVNPHTDYLPDNNSVYHNYLHVCNNSFVSVFLTALYATFASLLWCKTKKHANKDVRSANLIKSQKSSFLQCFILSILHINASGLYIYMQYFPVGKFLINVAMFSWFLAHGIPPIIYLLLNKSIRNDCLRMLQKNILKSSVIIKTTHSNVHTQRVLPIIDISHNTRSNL